MVWVVKFASNWPVGAARWPWSMSTRRAATRRWNCYPKYPVAQQKPTRCGEKENEKLDVDMLNSSLHVFSIAERCVLAPRTATDGRQSGEGIGSSRDSGEQCLFDANDLNAASEERRD